MSDVILTHDDVVCLIAEYIIERPDQNFSLRMGHFHGQPMIVEQSDPMVQLRRYIAVDCDVALSDEEFCGCVSEFLLAIYERQNEYHRNINFGCDGSLTMGSQSNFHYVRKIERVPGFDHL